MRSMQYSPFDHHPRKTTCFAQCLKTVEVGGEVDSMLMESGILFVGVHMAGDKTNIQNLPGSVRVYNLQSGSEHTLQGHLVSDAQTSGIRTPRQAGRLLMVARLPAVQVRLLSMILRAGARVHTGCRQQHAVQRWA